jgi:hypothetical protein
VTTGGDIEPEASRIAGDLLEGRVPSADAPPTAPTAPTAPPAPAGPTAEAIERAWFVHRMAAGEGLLPPDADRHLDAPIAQASNPPVVLPPEGRDGGLAEMVSRNLDSAVRAAPPGATLKTRHLGRGVVAVFAFVALLLFLGALIRLQGGGEVSSPGASGVAAASIAAPNQSAPAPPSMVEPPASGDTPPASGDTPSASVPASASASPAAASADPALTTLRGPINTGAITKTGMKVGVHEVELIVNQDTGKVTGTFVFAIEDFPIGVLLTQLFGGATDPDYAKFKTCTVRMVMAAKVAGTWTESSGKLKGTAVFTPKAEDLRDCLKTRPSNVSIDRVTKSSKVTWSGTFDGTKASGKLELDPALPWSAKRG